MAFRRLRLSVGLNRAIRLLYRVQVITSFFSPTVHGTRVRSGGLKTADPDRVVTAPSTFVTIPHMTDGSRGCSCSRLILDM